MSAARRTEQPAKTNCDLRRSTSYVDCDQGQEESQRRRQDSAPGRPRGRRARGIGSEDGRRHRAARLGQGQAHPRHGHRVGDGRLLDDGTRSKLQVKVGDRVLFTSYARETIKIGDEELLLMREEDILAVIE